VPTGLRPAGARWGGLFHVERGRGVGVTPSGGCKALENGSGGSLVAPKRPRRYRSGLSTPLPLTIDCGHYARARACLPYLPCVYVVAVSPHPREDIRCLGYWLWQYYVRARRARSVKC
jgi:hypothetical protein